METSQKNIARNKEVRIRTLINEIREHEPELIKNFITYWSLRRSKPFTPDHVAKKIKGENSNIWLGMIESNHKFRAAFGEDVADELVRIIEEGGLQNNLGDFITP